MIAAARTCRAPLVALRFTPNGQVHACGLNVAHELGHVGQMTLREIWDGEEVARLRQALSDADYSLGCEACGSGFAVGRRLETHASEYDRFTQPASLSPEWPQRLEFGLSNTCNLQCVHCNGELSSAIRAQREGRPPLEPSYGDSFFEQLAPFLAHLEVATFIGGEPFLSRECRRVWDLMIESGIAPEVHVTTNGTIWNDRVDHYLRSLEMSVSLSMDGVTATSMESVRVGSDLRQVVANRARFLAATRSYGGELTLNFSLLPNNWQEFGPFLVEADRLGVPVYLCRVIDPPEFSPYHLHPVELRRIVDGLNEQDRVMAGALGMNRPLWDATLADLSAHLTRVQVDTVAVTVRPRRRTRRPDPALRELSDAVGRWAGRPPLLLNVEQGRVNGTEQPGWSAFLEPSIWIGLDERRILTAIEQRLEVEFGPLTTDEWMGMQRHTCVFELNTRHIELRAIVVPCLEAEAGSHDLLLGLRGDLAA